MSYDVTFVPRRWIENGVVAQELQQRQDQHDDAGPLALTDKERAQWAAALPQLTALLPDAQAWNTEAGQGLADRSTGVQIHHHPGELSMTIPYWRIDDDAERTTLLHQVAAAVEAATGLVAYDLQTGASFGPDPARASTGGDLFEGAADLAGYVGGHENGRFAGMPEPTAPPAPIRRTWWQRLWGDGSRRR